MAREAREITYEAHTSIFERCERIQQCINAANLFKDSISFTYDKMIGPWDANHFGFVLFLNGTTYVTAVYNTKTGEGLEHAHIRNVESSLGHYTGTFLLYMQLIVVFLSGISDITLENFTTEPERAAKGIYKIFDVNQRGKSKNEFRDKNLAERLTLSEGAMRVQTPGNFIELIKRDLLEVSRSTRVTTQNETNPWNPECETHMETFFRCLEQHFQFGGSIKKRVQQRYTRKKRHTRRRSNKKRT